MVTLWTPLAALPTRPGASPRPANEKRSDAPPPNVPEDADFREERRRVIQALWDKGRTGLAPEIASPESTRIESVDDALVPDEWQLFLFHRTHAGGGLYTVLGPDGKTIPLSRAPEGYTEFVKAAGIAVDSEDDALAAAEFFLDKTRDLAKHQWVLREPSDVKLSSTGDTTEVEGEIENTVKPPTVESSETGYEVTLYLQRVDTVARWDGTVAPGGEVDGEFTTVVEGLPVEFPHH